MKTGVFVALITPLNEDERVDVSSLESLLDWVLDGGVKGVFAGGTIGEGAALRDSEKYILYRETVRHIRGRVPVLANVSDVGTARSLEQVKMAVDAGVDAVVSTARFGFPQRTAGETFRHIEAIASASPVPAWFYENPSTSSVSSSIETIRGIMSIPNVCGLKYSSSDRELFAQCVKLFADDYPVMTGNVADMAFAASVGATGAISGIGSLVPRACSDIFELTLAGRADEAEMLQRSIQSIYSIYCGKGWPLWPTAQKYVLKRLGVIRTCVTTAPFQQITPVEEAMIEQAMETIDPSLFGATQGVENLIPSVMERL